VRSSEYCHRWVRLQCTIDDFGYLIVLMGTGAAGTKFIVKAFDAEFSIALPPLPDRHPRQTHSLGDGSVGFTGATGKHDLCSLHNCVIS
jgi:hypothetical protein